MTIQRSFPWWSGNQQAFGQAEKQKSAEKDTFLDN
jgi:hypothetical protein